MLLVSPRKCLDKDDFTGTVIGYAMKVNGALGPGFVEYVYRNALIYELRIAGMKVEVEKIAKVYYEGINVGEFRLDLFINGWLVCELKAVRTLVEEHEIATVNYLSAIRQDFGLLLNFGAKSLQYKRKFRRGLSDNSPRRFPRLTASCRAYEILTVQPDSRFNQGSQDSSFRSRIEPTSPPRLFVLPLKINQILRSDEIL